MLGFSRSQQIIILCLAAFIALVWFFFHSDILVKDGGRDIRLTIVEAAGLVAHPGVYFFEETPTLSDIISAAGGLKSNSPLETSIAPESLSTGQCLTFYDSNQGTINILIKEMSADKRIPLGMPIDLNRAAIEDLELLPYISPKVAAEIVENRHRRGRFESVEDLEEVKGIGPATIKKLKPLVEIRP